MQKGTGRYLKSEIMIRICDHCEKELDTDYISYDFKWTDGHDYYGDVLEVCSMDCLKFELSTMDRNYYFPNGEDVRLHIPSEMLYKLLMEK